MCEPTNSSVHLPKQHRASVGDDGLLNSTNSSWESENAGVIYPYLCSTPVPNSKRHHSVQNLSTFGAPRSDLEFAFNDATDCLLLSTNCGKGIPGSDSRAGNLESATGDPADSSTDCGYGCGPDDVSLFPFDDFLNLPSDQQAADSADVVATSYGHELLSVSSHNLPSSFQSSRYSDPSGSSYPQESSMASVPVTDFAARTGLPPVPNAKMEISASSTFKCDKCSSAFAFQTQLGYVHPEE